MKQIPGYENLYSITENGEVWCHAKNRFLTPKFRGGGSGPKYISVSLCIHGVKTCFMVHKIVGHVYLGAAYNQQLDHIDRNRTNNNYKNLRPCTQSQNLANASLNSKNTSGFRGVYLHRKSNKWCAQIGASTGQVKRKCYNLGLFETKEAAALAYNQKAKELYGEFAYQNFI